MLDRVRRTSAIRQMQHSQSLLMMSETGFFANDLRLETVRPCRILGAREPASTGCQAGPRSRAPGRGRRRQREHDPHDRTGDQGECRADRRRPAPRRYRSDLELRRSRVGAPSSDPPLRGGRSAFRHSPRGRAELCLRHLPARGGLRAGGWISAHAGVVRYRRWKSSTRRRSDGSSDGGASHCSTPSAAERCSGFGSSIPRWPAA